MSSHGVFPNPPQTTRERRVRVQEVEQDCEARVMTDPDGEMVLLVRPGLLSTRAYVALGLALSPLVEQHHQQLRGLG